MYLYWSDLPVPSCPTIYWAERGGGGSSHIVGLDSVAMAESSRTKESKRHKKEGHESPSIGKEHASGRGMLKSGLGKIRFQHGIGKIWFRI